MRKILGKDFFKEKTLDIAQSLLGKYLVSSIGGKVIAEKITEVEAYVGEHDLASHSSKGKTRRTEVMFGEAGILYIYLVYGMYWMLNVVTEKKGSATAVLIRSTEHFKGPGVLTRELKITGKLNNKTASRKNGLWFEDREEKILLKDIKRTPRIGVSYAGPIWSKKKYRFLIKK